MSWSESLGCGHLPLTNPVETGTFWFLVPPPPPPPPHLPAIFRSVIGGLVRLQGAAACPSLTVGCGHLADKPGGKG